MDSTFFKCLFAPNLYRIYPEISASPNNSLFLSNEDFSVGRSYESNIAETLSYQFLTLATYLTPFVALYAIWHKKYDLIGVLGVLIASAFLIRSTGRSLNPSYLHFLHVLSRAKRSYSDENATQLRRYDFEFDDWPISFKSSRGPYSSSRYSRSTVAGSSTSSEISGAENHGSGWPKTTRNVQWYLGWIFAHTFGIRLLYPGTVIGSTIKHWLEEDRAKLVIIHNGIRNKIATSDGNSIDTMFFDRRSNLDSPRGQTLVICFEGNAGFYENGILTTPLALNYSVLGWNHPGFGASTGVPYPSNVMAAAEAVFDYATTGLRFPEQDIILFGWSIGGFAASHLAKNHPMIKRLILDASFDDLVPLALGKAPRFVASILSTIIRNHANLRIDANVREFPGPLTLIRRTEDEIIADPPRSLPNNRGNFLLIDVLKSRYPALVNSKAVEELKIWLSEPHLSVSNSNNNSSSSSDQISRRRGEEENFSKTTAKDQRHRQRSSLVIALAKDIFFDYKSSHQEKLPPEIFEASILSSAGSGLLRK